MNGDGFFDLAVPKLADAISYGNGEKLNNAVKMFHCKTGTGSDYVETSLKKDGKSRYCKDISSTWHFGVVWGEHYGVTFAVKPKAILKTDVQGKTHTFESFKQDYGDKKGILHEKLVELLKAATGTGEDWKTEAQKVNSRRQGNQCKGDFSLSETDATGNCFLWGIKFSKSSEKEDKDNCKNGGNDFTGCSIGIIDVSRYTLTTVSGNTKFLS